MPAVARPRDEGQSSQEDAPTTDDPGTIRKRLETQVAFDAVVLGVVGGKPWAEKSLGEVGFIEACQLMRQKTNAAAAGDLHAAKAMLMSQAVTLDAIFNDMARRAAGLIQVEQDGRWSFAPATMDAVTRIAFKAQSQCRTTLQTLGELVNPRSVAFIKQANMANGPQQVNNGQEPARAETASVGSNKLLEATPSERLDFGAQAAAGGANQDLEAVGAVNGADNRTGKVRRFPQRDQARGA